MIIFQHSLAGHSACCIRHLLMKPRIDLAQLVCLKSSEKRLTQGRP